MKGTWKILKQAMNKEAKQTDIDKILVDNKEITDFQEIYERFNDLFVTIGEKLANSSNWLLNVDRSKNNLTVFLGARSEYFFWGWQVLSLGGGVTVMEKREILVGWVTNVCLKCTKKLG